MASLVIANGRTDLALQKSRHATLPRQGAALSTLGWRIVGCPGQAFHGRANFCQHRIAICIAVTIEELLVGSERSDPAPDFFAKLTVMNRRWSRRHRTLDRPLYPGGFVQRNGLKAAFGFRRLPGDGLNKRHGLRDQKIAFSLPLHRIPQPPSSQQKAGDQSSHGFAGCPDRARSKDAGRAGAIQACSRRVVREHAKA
jgi:hypothetical protein